MSILNFLLIAGAIQGFLFVLFPFVTKKRIDKTIIFLNATVFFISANNLQAWLKDTDYAFTSFILKNLEIPWYLMITPCFYLFLIHYLKIEKKVKTYLILSVSIFLAEISIRLGIIFYSYSLLNSELIKSYTKFEEVFNAIYSMFLFVIAIKILFVKINLYKHMISFGNLTWLRQFMRIGSVVLSFWLIAIIINFVTNNQYQTYTYSPLQVGSSFLIYWIGYQGMIRYNLMQDRISLRKALIKDKTSIQIDRKFNSTDNDKLSEAFKNANNYLILNKRYLDPLISLSILAQEMDMSSSYLSKLINTHSNYNFSDYLNQLRIEYAKNILVDKQYKQYTIIAIGLESGFNSKSTFYTAFKKFTGQTPVEYRLQHLSK
ncbi:MAG: AraC family transcriptional regulator [Bacteroidetes bacterium]|nr:AraC family transcriptional regulator [Bacteroidota bacterium]